MKKLFVWAIALFVTAFSDASAADINYSYVTLGPSEGYPTRVNSVFPSPHDFIWLCSNNGLYRVAYSTLDRFSSEDGYGYPIPSNNVFSVCQYKDQYWFLTDKGLAGFTVEDNVSNPKPIPGLDQVVAYSSIITDSGVFFGCEDVVYTFKDGKLVPFATIPSDHPVKITEMYDWVDGGVVLFDNSGNDIWIFYPKTAMVSNFVFQCPERGEHFSRLFIDSQFNIWASRLNSGVERYDKNGELLARYNEESGSLSRNLVTCFLENGEEVWVGTDGGGIDIINRKSGRIGNLSRIPDNPMSFPGSSITNLSMGANGVVWACKSRGGVVLIHESQVIGIRTESIPGAVAESVTASCEDPETGDIWIATNGAGILKFDLKSENLKSYPSSSSSSSSSFKHNIYSIAPFGEDYLAAFCESEGIFLFDKNTGDLRHSSMIENLHETIHSGHKIGMVRMEDGSLLVLADMMYKVLPDKTYTCYPLPEGVTSGDFNVVIGTDGKYLFSHSRIFLLDTHTMAISLLLHLEGNANITTAAMAPDGSVWAISNGDIIKINTSTRQVEETGISYLTGTPESIVFSSDGNLWVGCGDRVNVINPANGNHVVIDDFDGVFDNEYLPMVSCFTSGGDVILGGANGIVFFMKDYPLTSSTGYKIQLTDVLLDGKHLNLDTPVTVRGKESRLNVRVFVDEDFIMRAKFFTFVLKSRNDFQETVVDGPSISYANLKPGKYDVLVACTTFEGKWTDYQHLFTFRACNKWYSSVWFWILIAIFVILGIIYGIQSFVRRQNMRRKYEEHKQKLTDESQRLNFLADLSHELRTPLTLILGPLERYIKKNEDVPAEKLVGIFKNAERIKVLLNTILTAEHVSGAQAGILMETHNINRWVKNVLVNFVDEAASHSISFRFEPDNELGAVDIDASKCFIVLSNIVLNAIKVSPEDSVITVGTKSLADRGMYRVFVTDEGPTPQSCSLDFESSFHDTEDKSGLGVGLSYSKGIIDSMGGEIGIAANTVKGCTIYFDLPNITKQKEQNDEQ